MSKTNTKAHLAGVQVGDTVNLSACPVFPNWNISSTEVGVVESVRARATGKLEAYVRLQGNLWLFPVAWLTKVEVK